MNLEDFNKIPSFFQKWSARLEYFGRVIAWLANSFRSFPVYKNDQAPTATKPDATKNP